MAEMLRWQSDDGPVVVEIDPRDSGFTSVGRKPGEILDVEGRFEEALEKARGIVVAALKTFRHESVHPHDLEVEFGLKLTAEAGAIIAKSTAEGHMTVKLSWSRPGAEAE